MSASGQKRALVQDVSTVLRPPHRWFTRVRTPSLPSKADLVEPPFAFAVHFVFPPALHSYPMAKIEIAFDMNSWHAAMTFASFECLESLKSLFPPSIKFAPNKPYLVELC